MTKKKKTKKNKSIESATAATKNARETFGPEGAGKENEDECVCFGVCVCCRACSVNYLESNALKFAFGDTKCALVASTRIHGIVSMVLLSLFASKLIFCHVKFDLKHNIILERSRHGKKEKKNVDQKSGSEIAHKVPKSAR